MRVNWACRFRLAYNILAQYGSAVDREDSEFIQGTEDTLILNDRVRIDVMYRDKEAET